MVSQRRLILMEKGVKDKTLFCRGKTMKKKSRMIKTQVILAVFFVGLMITSGFGSASIQNVANEIIGSPTENQESGFVNVYSQGVVNESIGSQTEKQESSFVNTSSQDVASNCFKPQGILGDNKADIIYVEKTGTNSMNVKWRDQSGSTYTLLSGNIFQNFACGGDWDGDGYSDYMHVWDQGTDQSNIFLVEHDGGSASWINQPRILFIGFGDQDGDGKDEIIYVEKTGTNSENVKWRDQTGTVTTLLSGNIFQKFACGGDWDGDGKDDYMHVWDQGTDQSNIFLQLANGGTAFWTYQPRILFIGFGYWDTPPITPAIVSPANHATAVSHIADLSWTGGDSDTGDTVKYDVYFGTSSSPPKVASNQTATTYDTGHMIPSTKYYWKIISWDNHQASTAGSVWDFTIDVNHAPNIPNNPSPADGATGVSQTAVLSWTGGDADSGDTVTYDVYFGTTSNPTKVVANQSGLSYDPPGLMVNNTVYYWKIVSWDIHLAKTIGSVWHFTTQTGIAPPGNPTSFNAQNPTASQIALSWTKGPGSDMTLIRRKTTGYPTSYADGDQAYYGSASSTTNTGLSSGQIYYYRAWAYSTTSLLYSTGYAEDSEYTNPGDPSSLTATPYGQTTLNLSWVKGIGGDKTMLRRSTGAYPSSPSVGTQVYLGTGTTASDTGLTSGTMYYYRAWAYDTDSTYYSVGYAKISAQITQNIPNKPNTPTGPINCIQTHKYNYTTVTTDPLGHNIKYGWDWNNDNVVDDWTGYNASGVTINTSHTWSSTGTFTIKVKAQNTDTGESTWSDLLTVLIVNNRGCLVRSCCSCESWN